VESVVVKESLQDLVDLEIFLGIPTVDEMFNRIDKALEGGRAEAVLAEYNPNGSPARFFLDVTDDTDNEERFEVVDTFVRDLVFLSESFIIPSFANALCRSLIFLFYS